MSHSAAMSVVLPHRIGAGGGGTSRPCAYPPPTYPAHALVLALPAVCPGERVAECSTDEAMPGVLLVPDVLLALDVLLVSITVNLSTAKQDLVLTAAHRWNRNT
jgi:hypothetical protein